MIRLPARCCQLASQVDHWCFMYAFDSPQGGCFAMANPIVTLKSLRLAVQASNPGMHRDRRMDSMLELQPLKRS